jgi:hypothetical protein
MLLKATIKLLRPSWMAEVMFSVSYDDDDDDGSGDLGSRLEL